MVKTAYTTSLLHHGAMALEPAAADAALQAAARELEHLRAEGVTPDVMAGSLATPETFWDPNARAAAFRPYVKVGSVAQIPVSGLLLPASISVPGMFTGYEYLEEAVLRAERDPEVSHIALNVDSPGGYLAGLHAVVSAIRGVSKPVTAFVNDLAASAGYYIASAADRVVATEQGYAGSIGVIMAHVSFEQAYAQVGIKVTVIAKGDRKADGHPAKDLSPEALAEYKAEIDTLHAEFVNDVAEFRGLDPDAVSAQESRMFRGEEAQAQGLVDEVVGRVRDAFSALVTKEEAAMADKKNPAGAAGPEHVEDLALETQINDARAEGVAEGAAAERSRMAAILTSKEAEGRAKSALKLALNPALTAEDATDLLASLPKDALAPAMRGAEGRNHFEEAMAEDGNDPVGLAKKSGEEDAPEDPANSLLSDYKAAVGISATAQ